MQTISKFEAAIEALDEILGEDTEYTLILRGEEDGGITSTRSCPAGIIAMISESVGQLKKAHPMLCKCKDMTWPQIN